MITIYDSFESLIIEHSQRALSSINKDHVKKELKIGACLIPGVDKFMSLIDFGSSVNENLTREKILRFLSRIDPQVDSQIIDEINNSGKYRNTVGTMLFELLDRMDSEVKPEILGNLFNSFSNKEISYPTLLKAAHILNMVFYI